MPSHWLFYNAGNPTYLAFFVVNISFINVASKINVVLTYFIHAQECSYSWLSLAMQIREKSTAWIICFLVSLTSVHWFNSMCLAHYDLHSTRIRSVNRPPHNPVAQCQVQNCTCTLLPNIRNVPYLTQLPSFPMLACAQVESGYDRWQQLLHSPTRRYQPFQDHGP